MKAINKNRKKKGGQKTNRSGQEGNKTAKQEAKVVPVKKEESKKSQQISYRKGTDKKPEKGNNISGYFNVAVQFLRDSKMELKKVKWPTRKELLASTAMVLLLVLSVAFYLGLIDFGLIKIIRAIVG